MNFWTSTRTWKPRRFRKAARTAHSSAKTGTAGYGRETSAKGVCGHRRSRTARIKALEDDKEKQPTAKPPTSEPVKKSEDAVPAAGQSLQIPLGRNCDTKKDVYWDPFTQAPKKLANQHVLIVGKSGAGKTQSAAAFMAQLWKAKVPCVIFDFQGEYMDAKLANGAGETFLDCTKAEVLDAADGINVNPLEVPDDPHTGNKQNFMKVVYQVATSLAKIFGLGDIQRAILRDAIGQAFRNKRLCGWEQADLGQRPTDALTSVGDP